MAGLTGASPPRPRPRGGGIAAAGPGDPRPRQTGGGGFSGLFSGLQQMFGGGGGSGFGARPIPVGARPISLQQAGQTVAQGGGTPGGYVPQYGGQFTVNMPPPPSINPFRPTTSYDPAMQSAFSNAQNWQQGMAANQDLAAQHAMQRQRASNSGMLKELGGATLLQQGAGGNRGQQIRNAAFSGQQTMSGLNAGLADSARSQQLAAHGLLQAGAGQMASNQVANNQLGLQAQNQAYGQQFQNWQAPIQLQQQGQNLNLQAQTAANQAAYQQAMLQQQAAQMNQQNYLAALQMMMRYV